MQAAGLLKERPSGTHKIGKGQTKPYKPIAKPKLVASITQDNSDTATLIEEANDGMSWITSHVKVKALTAADSKCPTATVEDTSSRNAPQLPNGRNAWPGGSDSRRSSRRRAGGKNKVGDVSSIANATAAHEPTDPAAKYNQNGVVNVVLYVGFALTGLGMILTFVGMGETGFKTKELQLIGPSLIACGILFTVLRIMFCSFNCKSRDSKPLDEKSLLSPSQETLVEDRQSTPPPHPGMSKVLSPLKEVESRRPDTAVITNDYSHNPPSAPEDIQKLMEDEVESDAELGLEVQYVGEDDKHKSPSQSVNKSLASQNGSHGARSNIPHLDASFNEVLLDPTKLDPANNG